MLWATAVDYFGGMLLLATAQVGDDLLEVVFVLGDIRLAVAPEFGDNLILVHLTIPLQFDLIGTGDVSWIVYSASGGRRGGCCLREGLGPLPPIGGDLGSAVGRYALVLVARFGV